MKWNAQELTCNEHRIYSCDEANTFVEIRIWVADRVADKGIVKRYVNLILAALKEGG